MRRAACAAVLALAAALGAGRGARAADDPAAIEQAKTYFDAGAQAYEAGRFGAAIQAFQQAYALAPRPAILFSMAQAERKAWYVDRRPDDLRHALAHYRAYLDQVPTGGRRGDAADGIAELEPVLARLSPQEAGAGAGGAAPEQRTRLMVTSPTPGARASLDGGPAGEVPVIDEVTPGRHHVRVAAEGFFDEERDALAAQGSLAAIDVALRERPATLVVNLAASAVVSVDGRTVGSTPLAAPIELPAGPHLVAVTRNGSRAFSREVVLERGKAATLDVQLESSGQRKLAWVTLGAAGAALVAGGTFAGVALVEQGNAQGIYAQEQQGNITSSQRDQYDSDASARDRWRTVSIATLGAGAGLLALGGVLWLFDEPRVESPAPSPLRTPEAPRKPRTELGVLPRLAPGGAGLVVGGTM